MHFDIHHAAATQTVTATNSAADDLQAALLELSQAFAAAGHALPQSPVVTNGLAAVFMGAIEPGSNTVISRVNMATSSTNAALSSYAQGDQQMSANVCPVPGNIDMPGVR